jgi:hypothetical protein
MEEVRIRRKEEIKVTKEKIEYIAERENIQKECKF